MPYWMVISATVYKPVGQAGVDLGEPRLVHIQDISASTAYEMFGVEVAAGRVLYDNPDGLPFYVVGGRVVADGRTYSIRTQPVNWAYDYLGFDAGTSHVAVMLEEVRES